MNKTQKITTIYFGIAGAIIGFTAPMLSHILEWSKPVTGIYIMVISSIAGITGALLLKKYPSKIVTDERDIFISRFAALSGLASSFLWFIVMGTILYFSFEAEFIKNLGLPLLIIGGMLVLFVVYSVISLVMYGGANKGVENE